MPQLGLMKQEIRGFLGVNLRTERVDLADEELAKAVNTDLHVQPGTIVLRLGRTKQFVSALSDLVIRRLAKINSKRYQVAGTAVYRDQVSILTGLSSNLITTLLGFRPLNDTTEWAFIADDSLMRKDNGTTVRIWGIASATATPTIKAGAGPGLTGNYTVRYTFVRKVGTSIAHESNPCPVPILLAPANQHIVISGLEDTTDPQVTHARFYRTVAGGSSHLFESEIPFWDTTTVGYAFTWEAAEVSATNEFKFTQASADATIECAFLWEKNIQDAKATLDSNSPPVSSTTAFAWLLTIGDSALGSALATDNDVPPDASWAIAHQEHVFLCRDADNPHYLWFSKRFRPESVPAANFLEIGNPTDPLQCAVSNAGLLGVFSRLTKYRVLGNAVSGFVHQEALSRRGTPAPLSAVPTEQGTIFVARDGVFATNFVAPDVPFGDALLPLFFGQTVNGMSPINWDAVSTMAAATYKNKYYLSYPSGSETTPDMVAVFSSDTKKWYHFDYPTGLRSLFVEEDVDDLVGGSTDGFVYILEDGTDDAGTNISLDVETKDYSGESPTVRRLFRYFRVDADVPSGTLTANFYVDGTLKRAASVTGSRTKLLLPLPETTFGYQWRVNFTYTGTGRVRIYGVATVWLPLGAS